MACVKAAVSQLPYAGVYRYAVISCDFAGQTLDVAALSVGVPDLLSVSMRSPGLQLDIAPGSEVGIGFFELDPTRPYVAAYPADPAAVTKCQIMGGTIAAALLGHSVSVTIAAGSLGPIAATPLPVYPAANITAAGTITGGSSKLFAI